MVRYDPSAGSRDPQRRDWEAEGVRALRRHLGLSQRQMAAELGTRQQTVSEWETGLYRPRGGGPGPDFRDAVIQTPGGTLRGDVELHLRASDFRRHGHDRDPAYDGLALHLVFWADEGPHTLLAGGRRARPRPPPPPAGRPARPAPPGGGSRRRCSTRR